MQTEQVNNLRQQMENAAIAHSFAMERTTDILCNADNSGEISQAGRDAFETEQVTYAAYIEARMAFEAAAAIEHDAAILSQNAYAA